MRRPASGQEGSRSLGRTPHIRTSGFFFSSPLLCPLALCPLAGFGAMGMARRREDAGMVLANVQRQWRFATAPLGVEQGGNSSCTPIASLSLSPYVPAHSRCTTGPFASNCANHRAISLVTTVARSPIGRAHPKALDWRLEATPYIRRTTRVIEGWPYKG